MIRFPFWQSQRDHVLEPLTPADAADLAGLHRQDFARPWSEDEFAALVADAAVIGFGAREAGHGGKAPIGFVLARLAAGEAEILSIAVDRAHRRQGIGWLLMDAVLRHLHAERAEALFLEVDEANAPALALYRRLGFVQVGKRPHYYRDGKGIASSALVMRRDLR
jgi:ribosomal-protein-alanine N-acetyltransferase